MSHLKNFNEQSSKIEWTKRSRYKVQAQHYQPKIVSLDRSIVPVILPQLDGAQTVGELCYRGATFTSNSHFLIGPMNQMNVTILKQL